MSRREGKRSRGFADDGDPRWVFNTGLKEDQDKVNHALYDPSKSANQKPRPDLTVHVEYGDGTSMDGNVVGDTVQVGPVIVDQQAIGLPDDLSTRMVADHSDGILGLGFMSMNKIKAADTNKPYPQKTWFENAIPSLAEPLFTVNYKLGSPGYINFGTIDHTAYKDGTLNFVPLDNSTGYWAFESASYAIGSGNVQTNSGSHLAVPDTGASIFYVDPAVYNAYYANVQGATDDTATGQKIFPCSSSLPDFHVSIGDKMAVIEGALLNWMPAGDADKKSKSFVAFYTSGHPTHHHHEMM